MDPFNNHMQTIINEVVETEVERVQQFTNRIVVETIAQMPPPSLSSIPSSVHTSALTGINWVMELINGHPSRMHNQFRMCAPVFLSLCALLHENFGLQDVGRISRMECLAIFLYVCAQGSGYRQATERFQRSLSTISKIFHYVLDVMDGFTVTQLRADVHAEVHPHIRQNRMYFPHFKNCIGGIDGTHVHATLRKDSTVPFIGRSGTTTQNVLGVCDFDMCFTYVSAGWEGSMHDARILGNILRDANYNFPTPPDGKYYLVDSGYPNMKGFLAPYKNERYHLNTFRDGHDPRSPVEMFNRAHASLRSVIERSFGVWKRRWHILDRMPFTDVKVQARIVACTMAIHNFIRRTDRDDPGFQTPEIQRNTNEGHADMSTSSTQMRGDTYMDSVRDEICHSICGISY